MSEARDYYCDSCGGSYTVVDGERVHPEAHLTEEIARLRAALARAEGERDVLRERIADAGRAIVMGACALESGADRSEAEGFPDCAADDRRLAERLRALHLLATGGADGE